MGKCQASAMRSCANAKWQRCKFLRTAPPPPSPLETRSAPEIWIGTAAETAAETAREPLMGFASYLFGMENDIEKKKENDMK